MLILPQTETRDKIVQLGRQIAAKHPAQSDMAMRAADIAAGGSIIRLARTRVYVQSVSGKTYRLDFDPDTGWRCNCQSYAYRPAVINGHSYCKHIMAMAIDGRAREN